MRCRSASDVAQIAASRAAGGRWQRHRVRRTDPVVPRRLGFCYHFITFFSRDMAISWHPPHRYVLSLMPRRARVLFTPSLIPGDIRVMCATWRNCLCIASGEERLIGLSRRVASRGEGVARTWRVGGLGREEGGHRDVKILRFHKTFEGLALCVCSAVRGFSLLHFLLQYSL